MNRSTLNLEGVVTGKRLSLDNCDCWWSSTDPSVLVNDYASADRRIDLNSAATKAESEEYRATHRNPSCMVGVDNHSEGSVSIGPSPTLAVWAWSDISGIWLVEVDVYKRPIGVCFDAHHAIRAVLIDS